MVSFSGGPETLIDANLRFRTAMRVLVSLARGRVASRDELYDLAADPRELHDLASTREAEVRGLAKQWREHVTVDRRERPTDGGSAREDAERLERLRALLSAR